MTTAYVKKNTEGGAAGLYWEAGEVKALDSRFADELVRLAPSDYSVVSGDDFVVPETPAFETPASDGPAADADNVVEPTVEEPVAETPRPRGRPKKSETPSAE